MSSAVWPDDPRHDSKGLSMSDEDLDRLRTNKTLHTRLIDYLLQQGVLQATNAAVSGEAFGFNICCSSTYAAETMTTSNNKITPNATRQPRGVTSMRKKMLAFTTGKHKFIFPLVCPGHFLSSLLPTIPYWKIHGYQFNATIRIGSQESGITNPSMAVWSLANL